MDLFESIDWEALAELLEPAMGLLIALAFMGFIKLMRSARRRPQPRPQSPAPEVPSVRAPRLRESQRKYAMSSSPIEPGDDAAKLANRYSQSPSR
jgi:hypothetical protein